MDCEQATEYGQYVIQRRNGDVFAMKVRLYDGQMYNWHQHLITKYIGQSKQLHSITDQVYDLEATSNYTRDLNDYRKVWFNGILIYKRPWWKFW